MKKSLNLGVWNKKEDLLQFRIIDKVFTPRSELKTKCEEKLKSWEDVVKRFKGW